MLRALVSWRRGLSPNLTRLWTPVTVQSVASGQLQHIRSLYAAAGLPLETERGSHSLPSFSGLIIGQVARPIGVDTHTETPSFSDVLKDMLVSDSTVQTPENWSRPPPLPLNKAEDLVFFQTETQVSAELTMFGVTKAGNSLCVRIPNSSRKALLDAKIPSMAWLKIPATKYAQITTDNVSHCQLEVIARCPDVEVQVPDQPAPLPPPLRILSFDIECLGRTDIFPQPEMDPVIQIGNMVSILGSKMPPIVRNIFTLDTCSPIAGAAVLSYAEEASMLAAWADFVREVDPDLIIGFNHTGFDLGYLLARAKALNVPTFPFLGRFKGVEAARVRTLQYKVRTFTRTWDDIPLAGRLQLDLMHYVRCELGATRLALNAVAKKHLGEKKEDVHFSAIAGLQGGSADTRRELAVYCLKDAYLPLRLLEVLGCVDRYTVVAHEKRTQFNSIVSDHDVRAATGQ
ncbi:ribonuclease H-like domain-containing protein [Mycena belliarum]|uniref:DNA polymerase delta catalytic subunit n=1 Tax=Mycena belliarum TaxID=1033014 RepID=A0AAD6XKF6_9AGAR|nr:ribonuclease H-like domain-containing protein [Mycena belliae]